MPVHTKFTVISERLLFNTYINAVLDHNSLGRLCDFTVCVPGHLGTGQTAECHACELLNELSADICRTHICGNACCLACLSDRVDAVVSVSCELVRNLSEFLFVLVDKVYCKLICSVCGERSQQIDAFCQRSIKAFQAKDSVHTVNAEESGLVTHSVRLCEDQGCGIIVNGQEKDVCACFLSFAKLYCEVLRVGIIKGSLVNDGEVLGACLSYECIVNALGIVVIILVDDSYLAAQISMSGDIVRACSSLVGVCEAHLENISESAGKVKGETAAPGAEVTVAREACMPQSFRTP